MICLNLLRYICHYPFILGLYNSLLTQHYYYYLTLVRKSSYELPAKQFKQLKKSQHPPLAIGEELSLTNSSIDTYGVSVEETFVYSHFNTGKLLYILIESIFTLNKYKIE